MASRGPVEGPPAPFDLVGHLVREVLVAIDKGPGAHEVPHELIGNASAHEARLSEEHDVHLGLSVQLEHEEHLVP